MLRLYAKLLSIIKFQQPKDIQRVSETNGAFSIAQTL